MTKMFIVLFLVGSLYNLLAENKEYYSIVKVLNKLNGITSVSISKTTSKTDCETLLQGFLKGNSKFKDAKVLHSGCTNKLPFEYNKSFNNQPINDAMYVGYINFIWPSRVIMYGMDKSWLTDRGCSFLVDQYNKKDAKAFCIYDEK
jgi:hypothetical protein